MNRGTLQGETTGVVIPPGIVWEYLGATPPPGWLLCDGAAVSRAQYPGLFRAIGTQHGAGDGNTTFNLPNRKGRAGAGQDVGQSEFVTVGQTGGSKSSTASHTHDMGNHQHARTAGAASANTSTPFSSAGRTNVGWTGSLGGQSNSHNHGITTTTLGGNSGDGFQGYPLNNVHNGVQTTDRTGEGVYGGVIGGCCVYNINNVYQDHDHQLENHSHPLEGHAHLSGGHTHADSFAASATNTTGDSSVVQAASGNLQPYIVVNYIVKV